MSWYSNTLFPTVESVFHGVRPKDLPADPKVAAEKVRAAGHPKVAAYLESLTRGDLRNIYGCSGLVTRERTSQDEAWAIAEAEWSGR